MPFFYDINRNSTTNVTAQTETTFLWAKTIANQETLGLYGIYGSMRYLTAGGATLRIKASTSSTGGMAAGGTATVPNDRNARSPAAQSVWANDASAITPSTGPTTRLSVGVAQTGGMGGWVPIVPSAALQMIANSTVTFQPADWEFTSLAASTAVTFDWTVEIGEGI